MARYFQRERSLPQSTYAPINLGAVNQFLTEKQKGVDQLMGAADEIKDQQLEYEAIKQYEGLGQDAKDYAVVKGAADEWYAEKEKALNFLTNDLNLDNLGDATRSIAKLKNKKYNMESGIFKVASENLQLYNKAKNDLMQNARTEGIGDYEQSVLLRELEQQYVNKGELKGNSGDFNTFGSYNPYAFTNTGKFVMDVGKTEIDKEGITKIYQTTIGGAPYIRKDHSTTEERSPEEIALIGFTSMTGNRKENASLESQIEIKGKAIFDKTYYDLIKSGVNKDEARIEANKKRQEVVDFENEARNPENYGAITKEGFSFDNLSKDGFNNKYAGTIYGNALNQSIIHNAVKKTDLDSTIQEKLNWNYAGGGGEYEKKSPGTAIFHTDENKKDITEQNKSYSQNADKITQLKAQIAANPNDLNAKSELMKVEEAQNSLSYNLNGRYTTKDGKNLINETENILAKQMQEAFKNKTMSNEDIKKYNTAINKVEDYVLRYGPEEGLNKVQEEIDNIDKVLGDTEGFFSTVGTLVNPILGVAGTVINSWSDVTNSEASDNVLNDMKKQLKAAELDVSGYTTGMVMYGNSEKSQAKQVQDYMKEGLKQNAITDMAGNKIETKETDELVFAAATGSNTHGVLIQRYKDEEGKDVVKETQVMIDMSEEQGRRFKTMQGTDAMQDFIEDTHNTSVGSLTNADINDMASKGSVFAMEGSYTNGEKLAVADKGTKLVLKGVNPAFGTFEVEALGNQKFKVKDGTGNGYIKDRYKKADGTIEEFDKEFNLFDIGELTTLRNKKYMDEVKQNKNE